MGEVKAIHTNAGLKFYTELYFCFLVIVNLTINLTLLALLVAVKLNNSR